MTPQPSPATDRRPSQREGDLFSLNRLLFFAVSLAGFAALALSLQQTWFGVPVAPPEGANSYHDIILSTPACTIIFKALLAVAAILMVSSWLWKRQWTFVSAAIASVMMLIPLCFPYFVLTQSPQLSADAAWLQMQHDNLTWLGGDIYLNAELAAKGWRSKAYIVDAPRQLSVVSLPSWSPSEFGLHRTENLLEWLGYSNAFCQFVGRGWSLAIVGSFLLFLSSLQQQGRLIFNRAGAALVLFSTIALLAAITGWTRPFLASQQIRMAAELSSNGDNAAANEHLNNAVSLMPVLGQDTFYVSQRGILDKRLGIQSEYASLQTARGHESNGRFDQAWDILIDLANSDDVAIQRESNRGILRFAIQDYNSARFELSSERFALVLRRYPCDVKLIYLMQLQAIREARIERVNELRDWMYEACRYLNFGTTKVLRASAQQHAATAVGFGDDPNAIWDAQRKAKRP